MSESKLEKLADMEGMSAEELLGQTVMGFSRAGICTNEGCDYTDDNCDPDGASICEECDTPTVQSACMLMGII